jgi:drug/metabolite transporter (DMT)-like permease
MKMNWWKILGVLFFVKGAILFLLFYYGMTGFVVMENISSRTGSVLALALVIGGVLIFMAGKRGTPDYATAILEQRS